MNRAIWHAALATAAVVGLQVVLPRIFSVVLWYHLGFFAVSLAMLGLAAGGLVVRRGVERSGIAGGDVALDGTAAAASAAICLAVAVVVRLPLDPLRLADSLAAQGLLAAMGLLLAVPFVLLGTVVCAALDVERERIGRAYGATFFGGAAGALLGLGAMEFWGAPHAVGVLAALPLCAAWRRARSGAFLAAAVVVVAVLAAAGQMLPIQSRKHFPRITDDQFIAEEWNAFSRVTFYDNPDHHGLWALPAFFSGPLPRSIGIAIDAWAITSILERPARGEDARFLGVYPPTLAYVGAASGFDALVIGAGGGVDVLAALAAGAGHVDAVEINPIIVAAVTEQFAEFAGDLYQDDRVSVTVAEGRHFVETRAQQYDRIVLSGVDTFAATEAGAFALSENYLYTTEALGAYLDHLKPNGVLALTRWWFEPPRQTLRLALTAAAVLEARAGPPARDCIFIARAERNSLFLAKNSAFDHAEIEALAAGCRARGAEVVFAPGLPSSALFAEFLDPARRAESVAAYPYRVDPTSDDRPFFFENARIGNLFQTTGDWIHDRLGGQEVLVVTLAVLLLLALPLLWVGGVRGEGTLAGRLCTALPFLFLGFAYLLVEIPLLQRLALVLGHPVYAVAVVLVALLVGSGCGSLVATRLEPRRAFAAALAAGAAVLVVPYLCHDELLAVARGAMAGERVAAVLGFLALPSFAMGIPFPLAIRCFAGNRRVLLPVAFLANGVASVVAGPVAVIISMEFGFSTTLLVGVAAYLLAALCLWPRCGTPAASQPAAVREGP